MMDRTCCICGTQLDVQSFRAPAVARDWKFGGGVRDE